MACSFTVYFLEIETAVYVSFLDFLISLDFLLTVSVDALDSELYSSFFLSVFPKAGDFIEIFIGVSDSICASVTGFSVLSSFED